ncbi:LLM class F420-dependent oxidoreductase [Microbacterium sp. RD1]|uniref:LLM class F420-dependent oxidoreductase n=1 Tax=Microbacterium sp. RD1 TaxID=3457313 RepID=UPI003FA5DAE8
MEVCVLIEPQQGQTYGDQLALARAAELHGLDGFFRSDHYMAFGGAAGLPGPSDAWTVLAGLARETSRLRLGTLVSSVTYRQPGILAIQVAGVDEMSGGRVELGLGAGWNEAEHLAYGIPFPARRFGLLEEQLEIVTGLWSTPPGAAYSFEGHHYRLSEAPALPKPFQERIPVIVGGGGSVRTPQLAARFADEFNSFSDGPTARERFARVRDAAVAIGRDPGSLRYSVAVGDVGADPLPAVLDRLAGIVESAHPDRIYLQLLDVHDLDLVGRLASEVLPELRAIAA